MQHIIVLLLIVVRFTKKIFFPRLPSFFLLTLDTQGRQRLHILKKLKSCEGPVLNCRVSTNRRVLYLNEFVIHEIRNNAPAIFQNCLFICCKIEFVLL